MPNIAFGGGAGSGKDTLGQFLTEELGYKRVAFADRLREICQFIWPDESLSLHYREKLTGIARAIEVAEGVGVGEHTRGLSDVARVDIATAAVNGPTVVTDLRFPEEYDFLKGLGFVLARVVADDEIRKSRLLANGKWSPGYFDQPIEHLLEQHEFDYTIENNDEVMDAIDALATIVERETER